MQIERLNINIGGDPVAGYVGSDELFYEVGGMVGGCLPESYMQFIRTVDGGCPEIGCFLLPGDDPDNIFEVNEFYSFTDERIENIVDVIKDWQSILGDGALPIGADGGGNQIYLVLTDEEPSVWIYLTDDEDDEVRIKVANSFEDFIASLMADPDGEEDL